ncbi:hypothetical protein AYL99_09855 [Fonsecaea erecta]|uniref:DASH complex subunit DAD2 n=1 Tax=Fonsecaea erecta TaxID=1367422 RepID=A0A178Z953_9EURO|nr:hypothetical protein AYL99_09855 [Fonsecaea erecta]OAP55703.1 hypothetical protein AYL99_09855 [Fonsecaea erecta]
MSQMYSRPGMHPSSSSSSASSHQHQLLQARIASKRAELENLRQLRDLSAHLTAQLEQLETKLGSLRDGAQAVALVLANWDNVLQVIGMAAMKVPSPPAPDGPEEGNGDGRGGEDNNEMAKDLNPARDRGQQQHQQLPVPLVRIPVHPKAEDGG